MRKLFFVILLFVVVLVEDSSCVFVEYFISEEVTERGKNSLFLGIEVDVVDELFVRYSRLCEHRELLLKVCSELLSKNKNLSIEKINDFVNVLYMYGYGIKHLDILWILSLMRHESRFDTYAKNINYDSKGNYLSDDEGILQFNSLTFWGNGGFLYKALIDFKKYDTGGVLGRCVYDRFDPVLSLIVVCFTMSDFFDKYSFPTSEVLGVDYKYVSHYGIGHALNGDSSILAYRYLCKIIDARVEIRAIFNNLCRGECGFGGF